MALTMFVEYVPGTKHAGTKAERSESMDAFTDCGMLLTNEDVVIDIDHLPKDSIKAMISEFGLKTRTVWTDRGVHLWFRKPAWFGFLHSNTTVNRTRCLLTDSQAKSSEQCRGRKNALSL